MSREDRDRERIAGLLEHGCTHAKAADLLGLPLQYVQRLAQGVPARPATPVYPGADLARELMLDRHLGEQTKRAKPRPSRARDPLTRAVDLVRRGYSVPDAALLTDVDEHELQRWVA